LFGKNVVANTPDRDSIVSQVAIVNMAFSEDVLKGNNSEPVELGADRLIVLRMLEHRPAEVKALKDVKAMVIATLLNNKAAQLTVAKAEKIKQSVVSGQSMQAAAEENGLEVQKFSGLLRANGDLAWKVNQAVFKAAKPVEGKSTVVTVADIAGSQTVINLLSVSEGVMSESDKAKKKLAEANLAKAFGQADFKATLNSLRTKANIKINIEE
jgi:peptidyl-prolyl cis-trans isomerase D